MRMELLLIFKNKIGILDILEDVFILNSDEFKISFEQNEVAQTNWNAEWEKNFNPIQVDDLVSIRAPFHEDSKFKI